MELAGLGLPPRGHVAMSRGRLATWVAFVTPIYLFKLIIDSILIASSLG